MLRVGKYEEKEREYTYVHQDGFMCLGCGKEEIERQTENTLAIMTP